MTAWLREDARGAEHDDPQTGGRPARRRVGAAVVLAAVVPVAVLSVVGFLGPWWWIADVVSALRLQYAVVLAVAAVLLLGLGQRRVAVAVAVAVVVNAVVVAPLWLAAPAPAGAGEPLRVHFHNVHGGGDERFAAVVEELASSNADVVFLSEVSARWIELFDASDLPYQVVHPLRWEEHRRVMVLSRVPVDGVEPVPLVDRSRAGGIAVDITVGGRPVRLLGLHVQSPRSPRDASLRDAELGAAADWASSQTLPVAMVGDFNATSWSHAMRRLRRDTGLRDGQHGFGWHPTWKVGTGPLMVPLDHVLHDPALTILDRTTGADLGSAHRSIQAVLAWSADG